MIKFKADEQFTPAPEGIHNAVVADVVYYGTSEAYEKVRLVWELEQQRPSGSRYTVTKPYYNIETLMKDLTPVVGHDRAGMNEVLADPEKLIGMPMRLKVVHNPSKGSVFPHVHSLYPPGVVKMIVTPGYRRFTPQVKEQTGEAA